ncbi:MAG TPA: hypothetical protein VL346_04980, partial [Acidobacteriaceae bacterium]|nr:hypothetical protein [Acidobacteriaceae bacterium]
TIPANALPVGADTLTAAYSGDSAYGASSSTFQITVTDTPPSVTLAPASPSITLSPGATTSNTVPITITPTEGLTGSVTLLAAISSSPAGAVNQPTVSFGSTSPVTLDGKSAASATLAISTTVPSKSDTAANSRPTALIYAAGGAVLAGLVFLGIPARKRRLRALFAVLFCLGLYTGLTACGGSGSSSGGNGGGKSSPGTTPGAYQITVTAIATNPNNSARVPLGATIINLTVQ